MKLYIASSWKMAPFLTWLAATLRGDGHEVYLFCEPRPDRTVFTWDQLVEREDELQRYDAKTFLDEPRVVRAFDEDKRWLDWAEGIVLVVPSGRSAHLEAGYGRGAGKHLWVYGAFPKGEFDLLYRVAEGLYRIDELPALRAAIREAMNGGRTDALPRL